MSEVALAQGDIGMIKMDQQNMLQQLEQIYQEASASLARASTTEETRAWHREYLGSKGRVTGIMRSLGGLSPQERPVVGKRANEIKTRSEEHTSELQSRENL